MTDSELYIISLCGSVAIKSKFQRFLSLETKQVYDILERIFI